MSQPAKIREHEAFLKDLEGRETISDELLLKWYREGHSVSKHMLNLYSITKGIQAKNILEVGFGRTSLVFARIAVENSGHFISCDTRDFSYIYTKAEAEHTTFFQGTSDMLLKDPVYLNEQFDMIFLDYFSGEGVSLDFCVLQTRQFLKHLNEGGVLAIHDVSDKRYPVSRIMPILAKDKSLECLTLPYSQGLGVIHKVKVGTTLSSSISVSLDLTIRRLRQKLRSIKHKVKS